jgi:exonuclease III
MRFGTWNVRSLYRSGSLSTVARELARYKLDLLCVQEIRWDTGGTEQGIIFFLMEKETKIINWE